MPWRSLIRPAGLRTRVSRPLHQVIIPPSFPARPSFFVRDLHVANSYSKDATGPPFKILFAGSDKFSCVPFKHLMEAPDLLDEVHVLVSPDKRVSRGLKAIYRPPLRTLAEEMRLPVHVLPASGIKDWEVPPPFMTTSPRHILVTASFGQLVPSRVLDHFEPLKTINIHPSLLPKYRGAAPIQWTIMNGDKRTGVTIQSLSKGKFDHGQILAQESMGLTGFDRYVELEPRLAEMSGRLLVNTLRDLTSRQRAARIQDGSAASYARKLHSGDARIDWESFSADAVLRQYNGLSHQFPLWSTFAGKRVQLLDLEATGRTLDIAQCKRGQCFFDQTDASVTIACWDSSAIKVKGFKTEGRQKQLAYQWWTGASRDGKPVILGT